jgi:hypothetical protein
MTFTVDDQPYRQPRPAPLEELLLLLHPQPLVRIIDSDDPEWSAWAQTIPDQMGVT